MWTFVTLTKYLAKIFQGREEKRLGLRLSESHYVAIPRDFLGLHRSMVLLADVMFVNNILFLVTKSRKIGFVTGENTHRLGRIGS